jgi:hypothetical protein
VEGGERNGCVELGVRWLPALEVRVDHLDVRKACQLPPCDGRELLAKLDAGDLVAALRQRQRSLARAAADLDEPRRR